MPGLRPGIDAFRGWQTVESNEKPMKTLCRVSLGGVVSALIVLATPGIAGAVMAITVPTSVGLGTAPTGSGTLSAPLGTVTVTASGAVAPSFTASVSSTTFITGIGGTNRTIPTTAVLYWSGPATASTGLLGSPTPGQVDAAHAQDLSSTRTAFSATGLALSISTSWNPTLVINIPNSAIAGSYTGTITHSVA